MLLYDTLANHCADKGDDDHACNQSNRPPRLKNFGCCQDIALTAVGYHLICHRICGNAVRDNGASEGGKYLIDDVAYRESFSVTVAPQ